MNQPDHAYVIDRYVMGRLPQDEAADFEEHLLGCPACIEQLELADRFLGGLRHLDSFPEAEKYAAMERLSFADNHPLALGCFNSDRETLKDVLHNGWEARKLRARCGYLGASGTFANPLFDEVPNDTPESKSVKLRRRPLDGLSLQSSAAHRFEQLHPDYFPYPYRYEPRRLTVSGNYEKILSLAVEEFGFLDYLQPLASVTQAVRADHRTPFITRCWDFAEQPGALIKTSLLELEGAPATELEGACICYQPPTLPQIKQNPYNYHIFRNVVGHEIGHYWWWTEGRHQEVLRNLGPELVEQAVSLFSVFLIMYRGYWEREVLDWGKLDTAFGMLEFETRWARDHKSRILDSIMELHFPKRTFPLPELTIDEDAVETKAALQLDEETVCEIRHAARSLAERAESTPLASTAAVIGLRKIDSFISFRSGDRTDFPRWKATDRSAKHRSPAVDLRSEWREYQIIVPHSGDNEVPLRHFLEVARHLAHIRLHGDWFGHSPDFLKSQDIERVCDDDGRDLARILALAMYAQDGRKRRRKLTTSLAKFLLGNDPSGLGYLVPHADNHFQWCCEDPDCTEAQERFLAEIREAGASEVVFTFWGEDAEEFRASIPRTAFAEQGFTDRDLRPGLYFKLFGVQEQGAPRLLPFRIERRRV
ncbi:MAG: zf-HC2 domain-containing protein [bacterium]|nr:zf-HC2 domain-containing protein [bacterium]